MVRNLYVAGNITSDMQGMVWGEPELTVSSRSFLTLAAEKEKETTLDLAVQRHEGVILSSTRADRPQVLSLRAHVKSQLRLR